MSSIVPAPLVTARSKRPFLIIRNFMRRSRLTRHFYRWDQRKKNRGLGAFVVRGNPEIDMVSFASKYIEKYGFRIINKHIIDSNSLSYFSSESEFWNYNRFKLPYTCIFVFDHSPISMYPKYYRHPAGYANAPHMDTARILIKPIIRENIRRRLSAHNQCIFLHCTDNFEEAMEYAEILSLNSNEELLHIIKEYIEKN